MGGSAGGIARHVRAIVTGLDGVDGLEIEIAAPLGLPVDLGKPVHQVEIPEGPVAGHRKSVARLVEIAKAGGYDVVHSHGLRASLDTGLARLKGSRFPFVASIHNLIQPEIAGRAKAIVYRRAEGTAVKLADKVLAPSDEIAERLRTAAKRDEHKVEVLPLGVDMAPPERSAEEVRAALEVPAGGHMVVSVTRFAPQKDIPTLLRAFADAGSEAILALAGEGPLEAELRALADDLGVSERVRWLGFVEDVASLVRAADVFCLSSVWEARALAAQEAMRLGTPVVATDVGGMSELIDDGRSGLLVTKGDHQAMANALRELLGSVERRADLAAVARSQVDELASHARMLSRLGEIYRGDL